MMFSIGFAYCWFCQLPETRNNIYAIKHQFRHIFGKVHLQVKLETESSKEICITNLWSCDFRKEVYKGMRCLYKKKKLYSPFIWTRFNCLKAIWPLQGDNLLFTTSPQKFMVLN